MVRTLRVAVDECNGTGSVAAQFDDFELETVQFGGVTVAEREVHGDVDVVLVSRTARRHGLGVGGHATQGTDVVPVGVRGDDELKVGPISAVGGTGGHHAGDGTGVVGGVDEHLSAVLLGCQEVHVVVHLAHRNAADGDLRKLGYLGLGGDHATSVGPLRREGPIWAQHFTRGVHRTVTEPTLVLVRQPTDGGI